MEIRALTGLRGIAAWVIVLFHFSGSSVYLSNGYVGRFLEFGYLAVDLFFILSGFVIFINYSSNFSSVTKAGLLEFYGKRLGRIYPLHLVVLLLYLLNPLAIVLFSTQGLVGTRYDPVSFIYALFLIQNWGFTSELTWNIPAWSISVEFAAYLLFPWLAISISRAMNLNFKLGLYGICLLLVLLPVVYFFYGTPSLGAEISSLGLIRCLIQFSLGCVLGYLYALDRSRIIFFGGRIFLFCTATALLMYLLGWHYDFILVPIVFLGLIVYLLDPFRWASRFFSIGLFHYLGVISYSTYMIHYFIKDWVAFLSSFLFGWNFVVYISATFVASIVLYNFVELKGKVGFAIVWKKIVG